MSSWIRYNYRKGFAHIPFARCRDYWGLNITHIKPQRIYTNEQNSFISRITTDEVKQQSLMLKHTTLRQWFLSSNYPITASDKFEPANLEQRAFAFAMSWKVCPSCCEEDINKHGFSYWHRNHQLASVTQCDLHGDKLLTSTDLNSLNRLILPHTIPNIEIDSLKPEANVNKLHHWNSFVFTIDNFAKENIELINHWKDQIYDSLDLPSRIQQKHRAEVSHKSQVVESELGSLIMTHIFRDYEKKGAKKPNILQRLFPGMTYRESEIHPIYWTLLLYWAFQKSELSGFSLDEYPSTP